MEQNLFTDATICSALLGLFYVGKKTLEITAYTEAVSVTEYSLLHLYPYEFNSSNVIVLYALFKHKLPTCCVAKEVSDRCPIPGNVQGQVVLGSEQPGWRCPCSL